MSGRALVTGGLGLIGAPLVQRLLVSGFEVDVLDNGSGGAPDPGVNLVRGDVRRAVDLRALGNGPWDVVFHLAAQANVPASVADPVTDFEINALGTLRLLEWARDVGVRRFVYPSTVAVYAPGAPMPLTETAPLAPSSPYGASKLAGEALTLAWGRTFGLEVVVLRLFNVYGPGMNKYVIHDLVRKLQADSTRLEVLGSGEQIRDYIHVRDAAEAFLCAARGAATGSILNLGSGIPVRIRDLAQSIIDAMGLRGVSVEFTGKSWAGDIDAWVADAARLRALGWQPGVGLAEGLAETVAWLQAHPARS